MPRTAANPVENALRFRHQRGNALDACTADISHLSIDISISWETSCFAFLCLETLDKEFFVLGFRNTRMA